MSRSYFCTKLCVERLSIPDHTVDHCDSLFCGAVNVCFICSLRRAEILKLWQVAASVAGTVFIFAPYSILAVEKKKTEQRRREREKRTAAFIQAVVSLPKETQRNVSARRWSAKSSFLSATILLPTSRGTRRQNMSTDDFVWSSRKDLIRQFCGITHIIKEKNKRKKNTHMHLGHCLRRTRPLSPAGFCFDLLETLTR